MKETTMDQNNKKGLEKAKESVKEIEKQIC